MASNPRLDLSLDDLIKKAKKKPAAGAAGAKKAGGQQAAGKKAPAQSAKGGNKVGQKQQQQKPGAKGKVLQQQQQQRAQAVLQKQGALKARGGIQKAGAGAARPAGKVGPLFRCLNRLFGFSVAAARVSSILRPPPRLCPDHHRPLLPPVALLTHSPSSSTPARGASQMCVLSPAQALAGEDQHLGPAWA